MVGPVATRGEREEPVVSIGLPVYNGERFLARAIESILGQTYRNIELIISDNASTDGTSAICKHYLAADDRVRYVVNERNIGAAPNFNKAFELATGEFFKWTSYDDWLEPTYVEKCIAVLLAEPDVLACWPRQKIFDEDGRLIETYAHPVGIMSPDAHERLFHCIWNLKEIGGIFGIFPTETVRRTRLMESYASADRTFFAEILAEGRGVEISDYLYCMTRTTSVRQGRETTWWNTDNSKRPQLDRWRFLLRMTQTIRDASTLSPLRKFQLIGLNLMFFTRRWPRRSLVIEVRHALRYYSKNPGDLRPSRR